MLEKVVMTNENLPFSGGAENRPSKPIQSPRLKPGEARPLGRPATEIEIGRTFDQIAEVFYEHRKEGISDFDVVGYPTLKLMLNGSVNDSVIADIACGTGAMTNKLLKDYNPSVVVGVDISGEMIRIARNEVKDTRAYFLELSATNMARIPDNAVDIAVCVYGLDYMNVPLALKEARRIVRPGGRYLALVPHPSRNQAYWEAGGNNGPFRDGWVMEAWPGSDDIPVMKQYLRMSTWIRHVRDSGWVLKNLEEPVPPEAAQEYAPEVYARYQLTGHRIMIFDLLNGS